MGPFLGDAIRFGKGCQLEGGVACLHFSGRPGDPFRPEVIRGPDQIDDIPSGAVVVPFALVRVHEVAIEGVTDELIIESYVIETCYDCVGGGEFVVDALDHVALAHALLVHLLGGDACYEAGHWVRQVVVTHFVVEDYRLSNGIQIVVSPLSCKLGYPVVAAIKAEGLKIIPEYGAFSIVLVHVTIIPQNSICVFFLNSVVLFVLVSYYEEELHMKRTIAVMMILFLCFGAFAKPTANDVTVALAAITDSTISSIAGFLNNPSLELPGQSLMFRDRESLPYALVFSDSDLGTYLPVFEKTRAKPGESFFASLMRSAKGPLNDIALQYLTVHDWQEGHAILNGVAVTSFDEGVTVASLMGSALMNGGIRPIAVAVDVRVSGRRVSEPVTVKGVFIIQSDAQGYFEIKPIELTINGESPYV